MNLLDKLNVLGQDVYDKFPYINHGGCCVYARAVAEALLQYRIKAKGIVSAYGAKTWDQKHMALGNTRRKVKTNTTFEWNEHGVCFAHVGLEFTYRGKVWHYDTDGCHLKTDELYGMVIYRGRLSLEEMKDLTTGNQGWNTLFDKKHIPAVSKMVRQALQKPKKTCPKVPVSA
jgi:hypothetical protein